MTELKATIFDLDGVLVDTAKFHYKAWKKMCDEVGIPFTVKNNERLKGVSRDQSLQILLDIGGVEMDLVNRYYWLKTKNDYYLEYIDQMNPEDLLEGVLNLFEELRNRDIKIGLGSSSKNARTILKKINIEKYFNIIVDGTELSNAKPNPEVFLLGAEAMDVEPANTVIFEDSVAGIEAGRTGGFYVVGIGDKTILKKAQTVISDFKNFKLEDLPFKIPEILKFRKLQG